MSVLNSVLRRKRRLYVTIARTGVCVLLEVSKKQRNLNVVDGFKKHTSVFVLNPLFCDLHSRFCLPVLKVTKRKGFALAYFKGAKI